MKTLILLAPVVLLIAGCSPSIDGTSEESFSDSYAALKSEVPAEQRMELARGASWIVQAANLDREDPLPSHEVLDGMTAREILDNWKLAELKVKLKDNRDNYLHYKKLYESELAAAGPNPNEDALASIEQIKGLMDTRLSNVRAFEKAITELD